jgi:predicted dinucleotide-binding enzyme
MADGRLPETRVGVLGSGEVGRRLAEGFRSRGHDVMIGSRELEATCIAWVKIGGARGAWDHGFKLLVG